jgi:large subunit ribosomal protein L35
MSKSFHKTKKSVAKRIKVTGTGKLKAKKVQGRGHLLAHKSSKKKRQLKHQPVLGKATTKMMKKMLSI